MPPGCRALLYVVRAAGAHFGPLITSDLLDLIFAAIKHTNRFVRETGYYVCNELVKVVQEDTVEQLNLVSRT